MNESFPEQPFAAMVDKFALGASAALPYQVIAGIQNRWRTALPLLSRNAFTSDMQLLRLMSQVMQLNKTIKSGPHVLMEMYNDTKVGYVFHNVVGSIVPPEHPGSLVVVGLEVDEDEDEDEDEDSGTVVIAALSKLLKKPAMLEGLTNELTEMLSCNIVEAFEDLDEEQKEVVISTMLLLHTVLEKMRE